MDKNFINIILKNLEGTVKTHWEIDHICYRTNSLVEYEQVKKNYDEIGTLLTEGIVGGRPIATFKLNSAIQSAHGLTYLVEVPAPKNGKFTKSGFEHIEVVIDEEFDDLIRKFPNLNWDKRALTKTLNPELELQFDGFNVKFHHHSLDCIIEIEKDERVNNFLPFLDCFKDYKPLISGTIPLGIQIDDSDLDILMQANDFGLLASDIIKYFPEAQVKISPDYLVANFVLKGLPIEIYAEKNSPLQQKAHKHLRVENRILKYKNEKFKQKIISLKKSGHKTEVAFGKLLNLENPYDELLEMYTWDDNKLVKFLEK